MPETTFVIDPPVPQIPPGPDPARRELFLQAVGDVDRIKRERSKRSMYHFMQEFWECISSEEPVWNWHIEYLCLELMKIAQNVALGIPKPYDTIINIPPGTSKSSVCAVMFPVWCWTNWYWMKFIVASYSAALSLDHAEISRDLIRSEKFRRIFPEIEIKQDKDTKSNFRIVKKMPDGTQQIGGNRYTTSVGGTLTGFHGHILIVDDPLNPKEAVSTLKINAANHWMEQTLSTRKVDKAVTPTILIMQRLHQDDPAGHILAKKKQNVMHICLPGEIRSYAKYVRPVELIQKYEDELLDPVRMPWSVLSDMEADLGQYGYAGQVGQNPTPPAGGMFKVDHFQIVDQLPARSNIIKTVRYWDKSSSDSSKGARTAGVKMSQLNDGRFLIQDVKKGRWATNEREAIIRETAEADGVAVTIYHEQEPGSGGKDSAKSTTLNLAGFNVYADRPTGDKAKRADPYSVQVNNGNVLMLRAEWNEGFIDEHRFFPYGTRKDQVDAGSGAFTKLALKKIAGPVLSSRRNR